MLGFDGNSLQLYLQDYYFLLDLVKEMFDLSRMCGAADSLGRGVRRMCTSVFVFKALELHFDPFKLEAYLY